MNFWQKKTYSPEDIESTRKLLELLKPMEDEKIKGMKENGFQVDEIHQYYKGICPSCRQLNEEQGN